MDSIEKGDVRGFKLAEYLDVENTDFNISKMKPSQPTLLENEVLELLRYTENDPRLANEPVVYIPQISFKGLCFGTYDSTHYRDSAIIFTDRSESQVPKKERMGFIDKIFRYSHNWYLLVHEHPALNRPNFADPYLPYGFAAGFLCEAGRKDARVISLSNIVSHCAVTPIPEVDCIHIMPVERVSLYLIICIAADHDSYSP